MKKWIQGLVGVTEIINDSCEVNRTTVYRIANDPLSAISEDKSYVEMLNTITITHKLNACITLYRLAIHFQFAP